jgi:transcriptional regulator with XRE-family HTH domain|tara:strand:+ start:297 stop:518 length:222 start_codon:yes stop_codon:yes gene_type:complete
MNIHWLCTELQVLRKEAPLSREVLASLTKTGASTIANFENGKTNVAFSTVEKWFNELGYEIDIHKIKKREGAD